MLAAAPIAVTLGAIKGMLAEEGVNNPLVVNVSSLEKLNETKYKCMFGDGAQTIRGLLSSQLTELAADGRLKNGSTVRINAGTLNNVNGEQMLVATDLEVLLTPSGQDVDIKASATPNQKKANSNKENSGPFMALTPGPTPSPSEAMSYKVAKTPANMTPGSASIPTMHNFPTPPQSERKNFHKIGALHPYDDQWCIKAKLERKAPLRTINTKNGQMVLFNVELVDDQGSQIQGTFWRQMAERYSETLVEGKVYVFAKFQVKPSNKQYSSVKNDYEITFNDRTEVTEAADQEAAAAMSAAIDLVPIDHLLKHITRKPPVDVMGVIVTLGSLGTVKRKSDSSELQRRDVTLVDQSGKTVGLTLWGDNATDSKLDSAEGRVMQVTACRVTDFNGCSLSTITRSVVTLEPDSEAANELKNWYSNQSGGSFASVAADAPNARAAGERRSDHIASIKDMLPAPGAILPEPDAKASWHSIIGHVASIKEDQTMYYLANPENGRKVVEQEGRYYSDFDGKYIEYAEHRYVLSFKAIDSSADCWLNMFNEQAEQMLGIKADDLASLKSSEPEQYSRKVKAAQWAEWVMTVSSKSRDYNGERKMRHTVTAIRPVNYVTDGQKLLDTIFKY